MSELKTLDEIRAVLETAKTVAVLGAHPDPAKAANEVPEYLREKGYRILPVNPGHAGKELFGERVRARLDEINEPVDVVDIFRRAEALPGHLDEILAMRPLPRVVWFQLGIRNDEVARRLLDRGISVVQDRCMLADHRRLLPG
jgi:uncharacterized protein